METRQAAEGEAFFWLRRIDEQSFWRIHRTISRAFGRECTETRGVIRFLADTTVQGWDKGAEKIFGYPASDVVGKRFAALPHLPPGEAQRMAGMIEYVKAGGKIEGLPITRARADGTTINCLITSIPIMDTKGDVQGLITTVTASLPARPVVYDVAKCAPLLLLLLICA